MNFTTGLHMEKEVTRSEQTLLATSGRSTSLTDVYDGLANETSSTSVEIRIRVELGMERHVSTILP